MRLFTMALRQEQDVVTCRKRAREISEGLELPGQEQVRVATAVSEIARNAFRYAREATVEFSLEIESGPGRPPRPGTLIFVVSDQGPGIKHLDDILAGTYRSTTGMGRGIAGAKRLMDEMSIETSPAGSVVRLKKLLPAGKKIDRAALSLLLDKVVQVGVVNPLQELTVLNQELLGTVEELRQRTDEVAKVNDELTETNRGVVALYDELDTVYSVSRALATKLDLPALLQAITDATTEVSGAEFGAFYHCQAKGEDAVLQSTSGPLKQALEVGSHADFGVLLGSLEPAAALYRMDDSHDSRHPLGGNVPFRSYLAVPVIDSGALLVGCLVFAHRNPRTFTERSERILTSVALQAALGLENARLYHSVQTASAAKDQFLAVLSHELRTPLNPVFAALASLEQLPDLPVAARTELTMMRRNLQLEARLIDDLLDMTRIVKGKVPLQIEVVDLHGLIRLAVETCAAAAEERGVRVELRLEAPETHVQGDAARLQQVFWNLLNNAVKFTTASGVVTVRTEAGPGGRLQVNMIDEGRGIEPSLLAKIFQPFEQGDPTTAARYGGLGLGLAICRSIVEAHEGEIHAESAGLGQGANFVVSLPLTLPSPVRVEPPAPASPPASMQTGVRILLVDDHADTRSSLHRLLSRRGYEITVAATCHDALDQAARNPFDLVISDLGLPDGSGHDLMRTLQERARLPGIALSGYGMDADIERSRAAGFFAHLTKPVDFALLESTIAAILEVR